MAKWLKIPPSRTQHSCAGDILVSTRGRVGMQEYQSSKHTAISTSSSGFLPQASHNCHCWALSTVGGIPSGPLRLQFGEAEYHWAAVPSGRSL